MESRVMRNEETNFGFAFRLVPSFLRQSLSKYIYFSISVRDDKSTWMPPYRMPEKIENILVTSRHTRYGCTSKWPLNLEDVKVFKEGFRSQNSILSPVSHGYMCNHSVRYDLSSLCRNFSQIFRLLSLAHCHLFKSHNWFPTMKTNRICFSFNEFLSRSA